MSKPRKPLNLHVRKITIYVPWDIFNLIKILAFIEGDTEAKIIMNYLKRMRYILIENVKDKVKRHSSALQITEESIYKKALNIDSKSDLSDHIQF
jgi:hypothetical protein